MQTIEFMARLAADGSLAVPAELADRLPKNQDVRVVVVLDEAEEEAWRIASQQTLFTTYSPEDSIYDRLYAKPDVR